jgi:hypothetical protein
VVTITIVPTAGSQQGDPAGGSKPSRQTCWAQQHRNLRFLLCIKHSFRDMILFVVPQLQDKTTDPLLTQCTAQSVGRQVPEVPRQIGTCPFVSALTFVVNKIQTAQPSWG